MFAHHHQFTTQLILLWSPFLPKSLHFLQSSSAQFCSIAFLNECIPIMNHFQLLIIANPAVFSDKEKMISCWMDCCASERWRIKDSWQRSVTANSQNIETKNVKFWDQISQNFQAMECWPFEGSTSVLIDKKWSKVEIFSVTSILANVTEHLEAIANKKIPWWSIVF